MSWDGMYPAHCCKRCGKQLNADGGHPAELYAGTYNGLCYACTSSGVYVERVSDLDGCQILNYPPHCPSWRRDRETFIAYADCPDCKGKGRHMVSRALSSGGSYPTYCRTCLNRYSNHPTRLAKNNFQRRGLDKLRAWIESRYLADVRLIMGWRKSKKITARIMEKTEYTRAQTEAIHDMQLWHGRIYTVMVDRLNDVVARRYPELWRDVIITGVGNEGLIVKRAQPLGKRESD